MKKRLETTRHLSVVLALVAAAALAVTSTGCERTDWDDPDDIARIFEEGSTTQQYRAAEQLSQIPEERREDVAPAAARAYLEGDDALREDVMRRLITWNSPGAEEAYLEEMTHDHAGYAEAAAETVGELGIEDAAPGMIEAYQETTDYDRRAGILRGLAKIPTEEGLGLAMDALELDVDNYPIDVHRAACEFIGGLATEQPDAITEEVRDKLVYARLLMGADGRTVDEACGLAIQQVGHAMVPHLIEKFNEEHEDVRRLLLRYDNPYGGEHFPQNEARVTAAEHLSAMRAPGAVELYVDELRSTIENPGLEDDSLANWRANEGRALNEMIQGLGDIGDPEARTTLEWILEREPFEDEWDEIVDGVVGFQMLQDSARALARLGDRQARSALMDAATADILEGMQQRFDASRAQGSPVDPVEQFRAQWIAAQSYAYLAESGDRGDYESLLEEYEYDEQELQEEFEEQRDGLQEQLEEREELLEEEDDLDEEREEELTEEVQMIKEDLEALEEEFETLQEGEAALEERFQAFVAAFDVMDDCGEIEDEAERAECFGGIVADHDEDEDADILDPATGKAVMELSRMSPEVAGPVVADALETSDLELRQLLTFAAYRVPVDEMVERIDEILEAEAGEDDEEYQVDHYRLRMLRAWLQNQDQEDVAPQ